MPAQLNDINIMLQAGINPAKVGVKKGIIDAYASNTNPDELKNNISRLLSIQDEQDAINRYTWYMLPQGLTGKLIERILYYKGQGILFYISISNKFFFLPYALNGTIDMYGRYTSVTPVPFAGGKVDNEGNPIAWINGLTRDVVHEIMTDDEIESKEEFMSNLDKKCVILRDYSEGISQTIIPRASLQKSVIDVQAECIPFMRTALINSTGVSGMRVNSEDEQSNVEGAGLAHTRAALTGKKWIPIVGQIDFQDLGQSAVNKSEEFFMAFQSLDNLRMSGYGLGGGVFNKLGSTLQSEANLNALNTQLILKDGLYQRQEFCNIVNSVFGTNIWVDISEDVQMADTPSEAEADNQQTDNNQPQSQTTDNQEQEEA